MTRLSPGDKAPNFNLLDDHDNKVKLSDFKGQRVVLYAYPAAMTPGCTTQACDFRDSLDSLKAAPSARPLKPAPTPSTASRRICCRSPTRSSAH